MPKHLLLVAHGPSENLRQLIDAIERGATRFWLSVKFKPSTLSSARSLA
jgi:hypothetical protein